MIEEKWSSKLSKCAVHSLRSIGSMPNTWSTSTPCETILRSIELWQIMESLFYGKQMQIFQDNTKPIYWTVSFQKKRLLFSWMTYSDTNTDSARYSLEGKIELQLRVDSTDGWYSCYSATSVIEECHSNMVITKSKHTWSDRTWTDRCYWCCASVASVKLRQNYGHSDARKNDQRYQSSDQNLEKKTHPSVMNRCSMKDGLCPDVMHCANLLRRVSSLLSSMVSISRGVIGLSRWTAFDCCFGSSESFGGLTSNPSNCLGVIFLMNGLGATVLP
jgi:hypothetical protein